MSNVRVSVSGNRARGAAALSFGIGIVALVALSALMRSELLPRTDSFAALSVWILAAGVLLFGMVRGLIDLRTLAAEWSALDLIVESKSDVAKRQFPTTVVARRILLVDEAETEQRADREFRQSNRALAAAKLAGVGNITRFASSALLMLVVIGTFAGMRYALPLLSGAIETASSAAERGSGSLGGSQITGSLRTVSEAVGSNLLALFGSLVLSLIAFGASFERRELLTSIEFLSERWLYRRLPVDADASELQKAVNELQRSVKEVAAVSLAVGQLGKGIGDLKVVLRDTIVEMRDAFTESVNQHGARMQQQLNDAIGELTATLGVTSGALQATAVSYEGLVKGLQERDLGVRAAADALADHSSRLTVVEERANNATVQAASTVAHATQILSGAEQLVRHAVEKLTDDASRLLAAAELTKEQVGTLDLHLVTLSEKQQVAFETAEASRSRLQIGIESGAAALSSMLASQGTQLSEIAEQQRTATKVATANAAELKEVCEWGVSTVNAENSLRNKEALSVALDGLQAVSRDVARMQEQLATAFTDRLGDSTTDLVSATSRLETAVRDTANATAEKVDHAIVGATSRTISAIAEAGARVETLLEAQRARVADLASLAPTLPSNGSSPAPPAGSVL
jgi:hypothetical protein